MTVNCPLKKRPIYRGKVHLDSEVWIEEVKIVSDILRNSDLFYKERNNMEDLIKVELFKDIETHIKRNDIE